MLKIIFETIEFCITRGGGAFPQRRISDGDKMNVYIYTLFLVVLSLYLAQKKIIEKLIF